MQKLAKQIAVELQTAKHYAVYEKELCRIWPRDQKDREAAIQKFAKERGWRLRFYKDGLVAIFDKASPPTERL